MKKTQTTVLGKRKATMHSDTLALHLGPTPDSSNPLPGEQPDSDTFCNRASGSNGPLIIVNGSLVPQTKHCYRCTHQGCEKAYTKPSRLEEHERSHTGQRPFVCDTCGKSYLRETHLHAHTRSHLPESARPLACERTGCEKRFWTTQHLHVHHSWHDGAKPYNCTKNDCHETFSKHHLLRAHLCSEHAPPGTKPYPCNYQGCTKSFSTNQHLRTHQKTHNDKRYTCVHVNCLPTGNALPTYFPTWSALQSHIRTEHPPTCLHSSCNGRTFSNQANLRGHLKLHEQREIDVDLGKDIVHDLDIASDIESDGPARKKQRGGEHGREWQCEFANCGKEFKSKNTMTTHMNVTHLGKRDFICQHTDCNRSFGYKHLLQRHLVKAHPSNCSGPDATQEESSEEEEQDQEPAYHIDAITGQTYAQNAEIRLKESKALRCPFPFLQDLTGDTSGPTLPSVLPRRCDYVFNRGYDLRRHLDASHDTVVSKETVDAWVRQQKKVIQL